MRWYLLLYGLERETRVSSWKLSHNITYLVILIDAAYCEKQKSWMQVEFAGRFVCGLEDGVRLRKEVTNSNTKPES
jgi:hypothetical protein